MGQNRRRDVVVLDRSGDDGRGEREAARDRREAVGGRVPEDRHQRLPEQPGQDDAGEGGWIYGTIGGALEVIWLV